MFGALILIFVRLSRRTRLVLPNFLTLPLLRNTFLYSVSISIDAMIHECPRVDSRPRSRFQHHHSPAVEPGPARSGGALLSRIQSSIEQQPFTENYSIIPGKELGRGKFAVVRKCVEKSSGHEFAAKFLRKRRKGKDCRAEILHEIAVLEMATSSSRVINLHQVYEMTSEMVLVLEYAAGGELFHQCVSDEAFSEDQVKRLMRQILEGVSFLHRNDVVHLDLKPQNILLTSCSPLGDVKIVDFGLSRVLSSQQELREIMGTPEYVAPEILNYEPISTATDMWSIGVLAYVMLTGLSPFLGEDKQETFLNISQLNVSYQEEQLEPAALAFIQMLLCKRPQDRATAEQCLQHPWLQAPEETLPLKEPEASSCISSTTGEEPEAPVVEELLVMAAYTLGQCRQSSSSTLETEVLEGQKKPKSTCFKLEEPFSKLQEIPGEFIY